MILDKSLEYFTTFSEKDIEGLKSMFSDDVVLRDWEISVEGIDEVLKANKNIFDSVDTIVVKPIRVWDFLSHEDNVVVAELEIVVNDEVTELVTDILEFDDNNKIKAIRAYRG
jgi:steroid delta-isomerase